MSDMFVLCSVQDLPFGTTAAPPFELASLPPAHGSPHMDPTMESPSDLSHTELPAYIQHSWPMSQPGNNGLLSATPRSTLTEKNSVIPLNLWASDKASLSSLQPEPPISFPVIPTSPSSNAPALAIPDLAHSDQVMRAMWQEQKSELFAHSLARPKLADSISHCGASKGTRPSTESCPCLSMFQMVWYPSLTAILCKKHSRLVPEDYLLEHLTRKHPGVFGGSSRPQDLVSWCDHVRGCHDIGGQTTATVIAALPEYMSMPLPLEKEGVAQRYRCPVTGCPHWSMVNFSGTGSSHKSLLKHLRDKHKGITEISIPVPRFTQMVEVGAGKSIAGGHNICYIAVPKPASS